MTQPATFEYEALREHAPCRESNGDVLHKLVFVQIPSSPPLTLRVFMTSDAFTVDKLPLLFPPQVLQMLLTRRGDVKVSIAQCVKIRALLNEECTESTIAHEIPHTCNGLRIKRKE